MRSPILGLLSWFALTSLALSQGVVEPTAGGNSQTQNYRSSTLESGSEKLFDLQNVDGLTKVGDALKKRGFQDFFDVVAARSRFERYLGAPAESGDIQRYVSILDQIQLLLSPQSLTKDNYFRNQQEAFNLLFKAAEFEFDANNSLTIATQVQKAWRMKTEYKDIEVTLNQMEILRKVQESVIVNRADRVEEAAAERARGQKGGMPSKGSSGTTELGLRVKDEARTQAQMVAQGATLTALGLKAKLEFQSQMVSFLASRRYRHAMVSSSFYRVIFNGRSQDVIVGAKEVKEFFPVSDFVPTLDSIDMVCREAIKDTAKGMQAVDDLLKQGEMFGAFERMQETYFLGEYEPPVMVYPQDKKREMLALYRDLKELQRIGDERDLANVEAYVAKIRGRARDFPGAAILAKTTNAMNASNMSLLSAKSAVLSGNTEKAEAALTLATKIWPQNPGVKEFANQVVSRQDTLAQKVPEFDRLMAEAKWREIFNKKLEYALALAQDKERSDKLRKVVQRVGELDANIQKASMLAAQNNPYLAWDVIVEIYKTESDDLVLAKTRSDIAPLVAGYAQLIGRAEKLEKEGAEAAALAAWLAAQDMNPASPTCGAAVKRLARAVAESAVIRSEGTVPTPPAADDIPAPPTK
jgi:hypothetical protein